jgi:hypothetical protein
MSGRAAAAFAFGVSGILITATGAGAQSSTQEHAIRWYEPLAVAGGIVLLSSFDQPVADHFRDHRSSSGDDLADAWIHLGSPEVYGRRSHCTGPWCPIPVRTGPEPA